MEAALRALADGSRRTVLDTLTRGPATAAGGGSNWAGTVAGIDVLRAQVQLQAEQQRGQV